MASVLPPRTIGLLLTLMISVPVVAQIFNDVVTNSRGQPIAGASYSVCSVQPTSYCPSLTQTYTDQTLTTPCTLNPLDLGPSYGDGCTNPGLSDYLGRVQLFAPYGIYWNFITGYGILPTSFKIGIPSLSVNVSPAGTLGNPQVNSGGTLGAQSNVVDVSKFAGADICAKINAAALATPGGTLDARAIIGAQTCSSNPFASVTGDVILYLGDAQISTTAPWVTSSQYNAYIYGSGRGSLAGTTPTHGTTLIADTGFPSTCQSLSYCPVLRLGDFSNGVNGSFGQRASNIGIDCNSQPGTVGLYSNDIQENSGIEHFLITRCPVAGILMDGTYGLGKGAENYYIMDGEIYTFDAGGPNTSGILAIGNTSAATSFRLIEHVTVGGPSGSPIGVGYQFLNTTGGALIGANAEHTTVGYKLGDTAGTLPNGGVYIAHAVCGLEVTDCVQINVNSNNINLNNIENGSGNNTIHDYTAIPSGNTITDFFMTDYQVSDHGAIRYSTSHYPANSGNGMLFTSMHVDSTTGELSPVSVRQYTDHPIELTLDSGVTAAQGQALGFLDRGTGMWSVQNTGASGGSENINAFQVFDLTNSLPRLWFASTVGNTGYTALSSAGSSAISMNKIANSGTGGMEVCSGGATPTCPFSISSSGAITGASVNVTGSVRAQTGGSTNHAVCWKTDGTLGYCSAATDSSGICGTCN